MLQSDIECYSIIYVTALFSAPTFDGLSTDKIRNRTTSSKVAALKKVQERTENGKRFAKIERFELQTYRRYEENHDFEA